MTALDEYEFKLKMLDLRDNSSHEYADEFDHLKGSDLKLVQLAFEDGYLAGALKAYRLLNPEYCFEEQRDNPFG